MTLKIIQTKKGKINSSFKNEKKIKNYLKIELYSFGGNGVLVCSIDNMPTQLPREATGKILTLFLIL